MRNAEQADLEARLMGLADAALRSVDAEDNERAQQLVDEALALEPHGPSPCAANARLLTVAATLAHRRGDSAETARQASRALAVATTLGEPNLQAHAQLAMARASLAVGDNDHTQAALEAAWPEAQHGSDLSLRLWCQTIFGIVQMDIGQHDEALAWYRQASATALEMGSERLLALTAANLTGPWLCIADKAYADGDRAVACIAWQAGLQAADEALPMIERVGVGRWKQVAIINRSAALVGLERDAEALEGLAHGLRLATETQSAGNLVLLALYTARLLRRRGELAEARAELAHGIAIGEASKVRNHLLDLHELACDIAEQCDDLKSALAHCRRRHVLHLEVAADRAAMRSKVLTVRLATERARAETLAERERSVSLLEANELLKHRTESLSRDALQDSLTGLANRRQLDLFLAQAHADAQASGTPLCAAMVDLDHFKSINDRYSHAVGDQVLQQIGSLLNSACRDNDLAARYGGEEFVIIFTHVDAARAVVVAERLRQSIQAFDWTVIAPALAVTASIGVCDIASAPDPASGLKLADRLLYKAKGEGRNRVVAA